MMAIGLTWFYTFNLLPHGDGEREREGEEIQSPIICLTILDDLDYQTNDK